MSDLSPKHYPTTDVDEDESHLDYGANGWSQVRPAILKSVIDKGSYRRVGELSRIFRAEHRDADRSPVAKYMEHGELDASTEPDEWEDVDNEPFEPPLTIHAVVWWPDEDASASHETARF